MLEYTFFTWRNIKCITQTQRNYVNDALFIVTNARIWFLFVH